MTDAVAPAIVSPDTFAPPTGWIRSQSFDLALIVDAAALSLGSGWAFLRHSEYFRTILLIDLWFLGFQHVVATYTRLVFDVDSFRAHRFLIIWLPLIVVAATVSAVYAIGPWVLATTYLYWQWFHYTRQSWGISRAYQRKAGLSGRLSDALEYGVIYLLPVWGILRRSAQNPGRFLGMELKTLPTPHWIVDVFAAATVVVLAVWAVSKLRLAFLGRLDRALHTLYQLSHLAIFWAAYIRIGGIDQGWLVINIWHNAQYLLFVWMYNNNRFKLGVDARHRFLSTISQSRNVLWYFAICVLLATALYKSVNVALSFFTISTLSWALIVYQVINFHHYVVDAVIWKSFGGSRRRQRLLRRRSGAVLSIGAATLVAGCARDPGAVRFRELQQTGCRNPGYPADLKARGVNGVVQLRYLVDSHGRLVPDSEHVIAASDSGFVDSAWAAIASCRYLPAIVDGHAVARAKHQRVFFTLPEPARWSAISDMYDAGDGTSGDSVRLVREAAHRLYLIDDYVSYANIFGVGAEITCLFLGIAFGATRLGWRRPVVVAFGVTTVATAAFLLLLALDIYEATSAAGIVRSVAVSLFGGVIAVGAIAATFSAARQPPR